MDEHRTHRAVWISDVHLGTRGCKAELLLEFLSQIDPEKLFLVGDIVDGWRLTRSWYWAPSHSAVVQRVLTMARNGTEVIYVPGNHDETMRDYTGIQLAGVRVVHEYLHETADGRRFLVIHGDQFDAVVRYAKWLALLGDWAYQMAMWANHWLNQARTKLGYPYWSLSAYLKHRVKNAVEYISRFEEAVASEAKRRGANGVICGHIHHAEMRDIDGVLYCNDGDWVESCTALVEQHDGTLRILTWPQARASRRPKVRPAERAEKPWPVAA
jgi:UDP-2,3-diacylglucosamine pyrophosphatase LpxH